MDKLRHWFVMGVVGALLYYAFVSCIMPADVSTIEKLAIFIWGLWGPFSAILFGYATGVKRW